MKKAGIFETQAVVNTLVKTPAGGLPGSSRMRRGRAHILSNRSFIHLTSHHRLSLKNQGVVQCHNR